MSLSTSRVRNHTIMRKVISVLALATVLMSTMVMATRVSAATEDTSAVKATLMLSPDSGNFAVGETFSVQVLLDTKGVEVSQVDFKLKYEPDALEVQDSDRDRAGIQIKDGDLFEVLLSTTPVDTRGGTIEYSKIALSEGKYYKTSGEPGKVATIDFKALKAAPVTLRFETSDTPPVPTKVYRAIDEEQILGKVTNADFTVSGTVAVTAQQTPTATPTTSTNGRSSISMVIDKVNLKADGKDKANVRVSVKDASGNPAAQAKVIFGITGNAILDPLMATTDTSGQVSAMLTAGTQAGSISISAHLESDPTVSTTTQIVSSAATATPSPTVAPTTRPTATPITTPQPVTSPEDLDEVGPLSVIPAMLLSLLAAYLLTFRVSFARRRK